jgi:protoporphyrinogen oxidase
MPSAKPIVVMGAGPAGLTAAWQLFRAGRNVIVWEADPSYVGGISRTVLAPDSYRIDVGGHYFFSKSPEVNEVWRQIMPDDFVEVAGLSRLYHQGKFYNYPLQRKDVFKNIPFSERLKVSLSYFQARGNPIRPETTFEQWAINHYGRRLYETFFRFYLEKVCGTTGDKINVERGEQEMKVAPRKFFYPRLGPGQMWETAANKMLEKGVPLFLDRKVQTIHWDDTGVTHVTGTNAAGEFFQQEGSHFISSLPLRELLMSLDPPPPKEVQAAAQTLTHRNLITVCLVINREEIFPDTTLYIQDPSVKVVRIQNYKNWSPALLPDLKLSSLGLEYICPTGDTLWNATDYDLAQLAIREIAQLGLVKAGEVKDAFVARMPKAYPVYDQNSLENLKVIKEWISQFYNLQPVGRNGLHFDNNQGHSMMTALLAVRNVEGGSFDCWKVDGDAQYKGAPPQAENINKTFKVVFQSKTGSQEEDVSALSATDARTLVQKKHGLATHLIVSVTEITA